MKPKSSILFRSTLVSLCFSLPAIAGNTWDGGGSDTNINTPENWNDNLNPAFDLTQDVTFATASSEANVNIDAKFKSLFLNRGATFTFEDGGGNLIVRSSNSGSTLNLTVSSGVNGVQTINSNFQIDTNNADANKLLTFRNNRANAAQPLVFSGPVSLAAGSTVNFNTRFDCVANSLTRFDGTVTGLSTVQQSSGVWAGTLVFGGDRTMSSTAINIDSGSGIGNPATTARLLLGETPEDVQSWSNITLKNKMKLVIGGTITAGNLSISGLATATDTRIVGNSEENSTLSLTGGTISNLVTIGGELANENNLNLIKAGSGTLSITGGTHTYTGDTTVNGGTLSIAAGVALDSPITVNIGTILAGEGSTSAALTFGAGNTTLNFDPATPGSFAADTVDVSAATTVRLIPAAATSIGTPYVALKRNSGTFTGTDLSKFLAGLRGSVSLTGADTEITVTPTAPIDLVWKGNDGTNPTFWDLGTTLNWNNGGPQAFFAGDAVTFDDTASSFTVAVQGTSVAPGNITFNNSTAYNLGGGGIAGSGTLTKNGSGLATVTNALSHTGGINVNAGTLSLGTSNDNTFTGGINITGGELQFGGGTVLGALNARPVTMTGGTLTRTTNTTVTNDVQTFAMDANGPTLKVDSSATTTWRVGGKISGSGNWSKSGTGVLSLGRTGDTSPANDFTGTLTVTEGTLDVRHADSLGSTAGGTSIQNAVLLIQNYGQTTGSTITVDEPLDFSGNTFLTGYNQENKTFTQQFDGPVTLAAGAVLGISTARTGTNPAPTLELNGVSITTGVGSSIHLGQQPAGYPAGSSPAPQTVNIAAAVTGPATVTVEGDAGSVYTLGAPQYSGNTSVNSGTLKLGAANPNNESSTITVEAGAKIDIAFSGNDTVATLILGVTNVGPGTYNASHPTYGSFFDATDTGSIVVPGPAGGFSAWAAANAPGQTVDQDHDNDGVDNGIEYFMGQTGSGFTDNPALNTSGVITWPMGASYAGTYDTDYVVQTSGNLTTWSDVPVGGVTIVPGTSLTYTLTGTAPRFVRLLVKPD